jgi:hypothetical protein
MISWQRMGLRFLRSQAIRFDRCPLRVISGHCVSHAGRPLYIQKETSLPKKEKGPAQ